MRPAVPLPIVSYATTHARAVTSKQRRFGSCERRLGTNELLHRGIWLNFRTKHIDLSSLPSLCNSKGWAGCSPQLSQAALWRCRGFCCRLQSLITAISRCWVLKLSHTSRGRRGTLLGTCSKLAKLSLKYALRTNRCRVILWNCFTAPIFCKELNNSYPVAMISFKICRMTPPPHQFNPTKFCLTII